MACPGARLSLESDEVKYQLKQLYSNLTTCVLGSESVSELLITGLLAGGHILIRGAPGMGKTTLARTVAASIQTTFKRIQFTPDLLPSEIIGFNMYDQASGQFVLHKGPVFSNVILADEINRAGPRTQSALLESMQERQVTIDGITYPLERPFFVIATENFLSSAGTFPLPDSQLDRFLISFDMGAPDESTLVDILNSHISGTASTPVTPALNGDQLVDMQQAVRNVHVAPGMAEYIARLCMAIGAHKAVAAVPSTRASIALMQAARAQAWQQGRESLYPDDVKKVLPFVFRHRLTVRQGSERKAGVVEGILDEVGKSTPVPMVRHNG